MKIMAIVLLGFAVQSCALPENGVKQCENIIRGRLNAPTFLKRLPDEIGDLNTSHPNVESNYDQRTIDINFEDRAPGKPPVAHRYECIFRLSGGQLGALVSSGERPPRLLNYGQGLTRNN